MHVQHNIQGWTAGLAPGVAQVVVAVDRGDMLVTAAQVNPQSIRVLRHCDDGLQQFSPDWEGALWLARRWWSTFVDGTFRANFAPYVHYVKGYNETLANSQNAEEVRQRCLMERALAHVWNTEYRTQADYAHIRPVLASAAVGNDIPEEIARISMEYDAVLSYHAYFYIDHGVRPDWEYENLSGRWVTMEEEWDNARPTWMLATEGGPFQSAETGWRAKECLNGNLPAYIRAMRTQIQEITATLAYREGRVIGPPVWFTSGGGPRWPSFETTETELRELAQMLREEWQPAPPPEPEPEPEPLPEQVRVTAWPGLRMRSGPGTDNGILTVLPYHSGPYEVIDKAGDWRKVAGWCHARYLEEA